MQCQILRRIWTSERQAFTQRRYTTIHDSHPFIKKTIGKIHHKTNDPLWALVPLVQDAPVYHLTGALRKASVPLDEYKRWQHCLEQPTLGKALGYVKDHESLPNWVLFNLLGCKVNTLSDAVDPLMDLLASQLPSCPPHLRAAALVLSAAQMSSRELIIPLRAILDQFLLLPPLVSTPTFPPDGLPSRPNHQVLCLDGSSSYDLYINLFLEALAQVPAHSELYRDYVVKATLATANGPHCKIHPQTYLAMLRIGNGTLEDALKGDRVAGYRLARFLQNRMTLEELTPTPDLTMTLDHYFNAAELEKARKAKREAWRYQEIEGENGDDGGKQKQRPHSAKPQTWTSQRHEPLKYGHLLRSTHAGALMGKKKFMDEQDTVRLLKLAAHDMKLKTDDFFKLFRRVSRVPWRIASHERMQASIETYAILLQGLLFRKELKRAAEYCHFLFENSGLPLNTKVVTLGATIFTRSGRPESAADLLESVTLKPPSLYRRSLSPSSTPALPDLGDAADPVIPSVQPVTLDATVMNTWMHALRSIGRPKAVLSLWDDMYTLYGTAHNSGTINIMFQTARKLALQNEQSIRRQFAKYFSSLRLKKKENASDVKGFELKEAGASFRSVALESLRATISDKKNQKSGTGLWRGDQPEETARKIFLQIMFGMDLARNPNSFLSPTPIHTIKAPARSVRRNWDSGGGIVGLGVGLPSLKMERYSFDDIDESEMYRVSRRVTTGLGSTPESWEWVRRPRYPHLALDDSNFFDYLCLLSVTQRTTEVALTMAWMRHLRVYPSQATLALAMVLWGEVSVEAPIVQGLSNLGRPIEDNIGGERNSIDEYERFVLWLGKWVGKEKIPEDHTLRQFRVAVKNIRNSESAPKKKKAVDK